MKKSSKTVYYFGIYLFFVSITLMVAPNFFLSNFMLPTTNEVWIRVVGVTVFSIAYYYIVAAKNNYTQLIQATVFVRFFVLFTFSCFVAMKLVSPIFISMGVIDFVAAIWTQIELNKEKKITTS